MLPRERYIKALTFGATDKIPLQPGGPRKSTLERWRAEGLPEGVGHMEYVYDRLGIDPGSVYGPSEGFFVDFRMIPMFEEKVIEHKDGHYIVQDWMGAITEISDKYDYTYIRNAIDFVTRRWHSFPVKNADDWEQMKERYDPRDLRRLTGDLDTVGKKLRERNYIITVSVNGPFWQMREWLGMENLCMLFLDDPGLAADMAQFWCDFVLTVMRRFLPYVQPDVFRISEDMAYKAHSMISRSMTREFLQPVYVKWITELKKYSVPIIDMDSDGFVGELIPIWIESGINVCDPIEVAAYNDIVQYRRKYGKKMGYNGGIDKRAIAAGGETLRAEVMRVVPPLLAEGGFIPSCDHGVPPDISLENFIDYTALLASLTGWM
ncbi:MAG: uroporphyrinogen decarboxylase family protein [Eubacteriales bacterium]|nr:uroporphyrinogen decarboxylase family protein [Eubacteriales bacterium]